MSMIKFSPKRLNNLGDQVKHLMLIFTKKTVLCFGKRLLPCAFQSTNNNNNNTVAPRRDATGLDLFKVLPDQTQPDTQDQNKVLK